MSKPKFKYNLQHFFSLLPREVTWKMVEDYAERFGINPRTCQRDRAILPDDVEDIPTMRLYIYSKMFGCTIDDLVNYSFKIKPFKSIL